MPRFPALTGLVLLSLALVSASASDSVVPPAGCGTYQAGLTCTNGGAFAAACSAFVPCALDPPGYVNWDDHYTCTCPPGYSGADCSVVSDAKVCAAEGKALDSTVLLDNRTAAAQGTRLYTECHVPDPKNNLDLDLRLHRVNITASPAGEPGRLDVRFSFLSRHRNSSIHSNKDPHWHECVAMAPNLDCRFSCRVIPSGYLCDSASCTSCASNPDAFCSPLLEVQAVVLNETSPSAPTMFKTAGPTNSSDAVAVMFTSTDFDFDFSCRAGRCVTE